MADSARKIAAFFDGSQDWKAELAAFRAILQDCGLDETFKWRSPVYVAEGGNIAILWRFKDRCALGFFRGVLLDDPAGLLAAPGENSRVARVLNVTGTAEIARHKAAIQGFIAQAIALQREGRKVALPKDDLAYPAELVARLDADPAFRAAFEALTPGRRRGYVLHFGQARQSATRSARIARHAPRILAGKEMHDR